MKFLIATLLTLTVSQAFARDINAEVAAIEAVEAAAKTLSAHNLTCETVADCQVLHLGSKACGGPKDYLVVSKRNLTLEAIEYLAHDSQVRESSFNQRYGQVSDCSIRREPALKCVAQVCKGSNQ